MREINLREYATSDALTLSVDERDALAREALNPSITPVPGTTSQYTLTPGSVVGAVETGGLSVRVAPKIGIRQLLSLACYAIGKVKPQEAEFDFPEHEALSGCPGAGIRRRRPPGILARAAPRLSHRGGCAARGARRIRFDEQIRRRFGIPLPVEVRYDEFTDDILLNRLVKAAADRLGRLGLRSPKARSGIAWVAESLSDVSLVAFPRGAVPDVRFDRLNEHYRSVATLARLILRHGAFEASRGKVRASGFLMNMNQVFEEFVTVALREALGVSERVFGKHGIGSLDMEGHLDLRPDLVWRDGSRCTFVGDVKYKRVDGGVPNADLYQLLAYTTALGPSRRPAHLRAGRTGAWSVYGAPFRQTAGSRHSRPFRRPGGIAGQDQSCGATHKGIALLGSMEGAPGRADGQYLGDQAYCKGRIRAKMC